MTDWNHTLIVLIVIFAGGLIVGKITEKPRIPDVAGYLLLGIVVGPTGLNWISEPAASQVNLFILYLGAALILFDGGRAVSFAVLKRVWISITLLATVGVLVSAVTVGVAAHFLMGTSWLLSLLMASVIASTDPATLIPVFKRVPIVSRLQQTVESESAFNDATASVLVVTLIGMMGASGAVHLLSPVADFLKMSVIGIGVGLTLGLLSLWLVSHKGWGVFHEYSSIVMFTIAIGSYQLAEGLHASGFMAAFVAGAVSGNGRAFGWWLPKHTEANIHHFSNAMTLLMRMMIFVLLGTQVNFSVVHQYLWAGLAIVGVLVLIARPLTVLTSVLPDGLAKWKWREILFMFWVRETGVIPAALAGMVLSRHIPGADMIGAVTFLAILITILLQASTTGIVAKGLKVALNTEEEDV